MNRLLIVIGLFALLFSCSNTQRCNALEQKIMSVCVMADSTYTVTLGSLTDFAWDTLFVISGPTVDNEAEEFVGRDYKKIIPDNSRQYIFIKSGEIVKEYSSYCSLNLSKVPSKSIGHRYLSSSQFQVEKKESEGGFIYSLKEIEN